MVNNSPVDDRDQILREIRGKVIDDVISSEIPNYHTVHDIGDDSDNMVSQFVRCCIDSVLSGEYFACYGGSGEKLTPQGALRYDTENRVQIEEILNERFRNLGIIPH